MKAKMRMLVLLLVWDLGLAVGFVRLVGMGQIGGSGRFGAAETLLPADGLQSAANSEEYKSSAQADDGKILALTFDDGPHAVYTKKLLDGLRERGVKASFFLVGENIPGNEELIRQMAEDGHLIGVHCYSHEDLTKKTAQAACIDIQMTSQKIEEITGQKPQYIRPPYGSWNEELGECVEMTPVFWDIDTLDWKSRNRESVVRHIRREAGKHQVALLHDVFDTSVDAALETVDELMAQGYTFVTVDELTID